MRPTILNLRMRCYLQLKEFDSAIKIFKDLISDYPDWERPYFNLGRVYLEMGVMDQALKLFEEAILLSPEDEDAYYYLGIYHYNNKDYEEARKCYEKSLTLNPNQPETHLNLGTCYSQMKLYEKALIEFDLVCKIDQELHEGALIDFDAPDLFDQECLDAIYNKGLALFYLEKYDEAIKKYILLNQLTPTDTEVMMKIADCYYEKRDKENAIIWSKKVLAAEPENESAHDL